MLGQGESVAGPHAPRRGATCQPAGRARPLARDPPRSRSPGARPPGGEAVCEAPVPAGSGLRLGPERVEETSIWVLLSAGKGTQRRLSVPQGFMRREGARLEAAGGKEAAFLPGEQRAGRWAGGGGLRSSPPRLAPSGFRREALGSTSLTPAWVGGIHCSFVPRKGKNGAEVPAAMLLPVSSAC